MVIFISDVSFAWVLIDIKSQNETLHDFALTFYLLYYTKYDTLHCIKWKKGTTAGLKRRTPIYYTKQKQSTTTGPKRTTPIYYTNSRTKEENPFIIPYRTWKKRQEGEDILRKHFPNKGKWRSMQRMDKEQPLIYIEQKRRRKEKEQPINLQRAREGRSI